MTPQGLFVIGVLAVAAVLFALNRPRVDIVAVMVVLALILGDVLPVRDALAGFADPVVILIAALFVIGEALVSTGVANRLGDLVLKFGGSDEVRLIALLMAVTAGIGAFMSSTAVVALFVPVAITLSERSGISRRQLLMPLSIAGLISGMMTLIATAPNLIVADALTDRGLDSLGFFSFAPFGVAALALGILHVLAIGRRQLAKGAMVAETRPGRTIVDLAAAYGLRDRVARLSVLPGSPLHDHTVARMRLREQFGIILVGVDKGRGSSHAFEPALPETVFRVGDTIFAAGDATAIATLCDAVKLRIEPPLSEEARRLAMQRIGVAEIMFAPDSRLSGRTIGELEFRSRYHVTVLAVRHGGENKSANLATTRLDFGDTFLVAGGWDDILRLGRDRETFLLLTLPEEHKAVAPTQSRAPAAVGILVAMVVAMASGVVPTVAAALLAALAMLGFGCVKLNDVYRSIQWPTIVLLAGILPLATALTETGVSAVIADRLVATLAPLGVLGMLAILFIITAAVGLFISNTATAVLIAPIAIDAALAVGASPQAFAMTVAIACSAAFVTPVSSPVNMLVLEPGGYSFTDFVKVGLPLQMLIMIATVLLAAAIYP
jgi:di/tricarboxylate transporter